MAALLSIYQHEFLTFLLILTRISGLVIAAPVLGLKAAPMQVRAILAVTLALLVTPFYWQAGEAVVPAGHVDLAIAATRELMLGLSLGLSIAVLFSGLQATGVLAGQLSGMSLADVFDPTQDTSVPLLADFIDRVALAVFVIIGGHRELLAVLLDTFRWMPPGRAMLQESLLETLLEIATGSLALGIRAAAPAMVALLLANLILGLISRTLPQLNVMAVGFGINAMLLMLLAAASLSAVVWLFQEGAWDTMDAMRTTLLDSASRWLKTDG